MKECFTARLEDLLKKYDAGEKQWFDQFFSLIYDCIERKIHSMMKSEPFVHRWQQTDDILHETLIRLEKSLCNQCPKTKIEFFRLASTIIQYAIVDAARNLRSDHSHAVNHHTTSRVDADAADNAGSCLAAGTVCDNASLLLECDDLIEHCLDPRSGDVVRMHVFMDMRLQDIALELNISLSTVKRMWRQARMILADKLQKG